MAACGDTKVSYNEWDWIVEMNRASYIGLLAHSCMESEEYHFMASASGLVYIMASMGCQRGGQLCIAFSKMKWHFLPTIFAAFRSCVPGKE